MRRSIMAAAFAAVLACSSFLSAQDTQNTDEAKRVRDATTVFGEIMGAEDKAIPRAILGKAEGIAIFPDTVKAGFIVGGTRGRGILSVRSATGWSAPAFLTLTGGSIGAQIGGQEVDLVLVVIDERGLEQLAKNQFKVGADAGVSAGPVGRNSEASTDVQMRAKILSYSRSRGMFAGITLNGASVKQDRDANERFYGQAYRTSQIIIERLGGAPDPVPAWRDLLSSAAK